MASVTLQVRVSPEEFKAISTEAKKQARTISNLLRLFIARGLGK